MIPKLHLPPRISDLVLDPLSLSDHIKYVSLYLKYKRMIHDPNVERSDMQIRLSYVLDWFRNIDVLFRDYNKELGLAYITNTHPAEEWPDVNLGTIGVTEFVFHWQCGNPLPECFQRYYLSAESRHVEFKCLYTGMNVHRSKLTLRRGIPTYPGVDVDLLKPVRIAVVVDEEWDEPDYISRFKALHCDQAVLSINPDSYAEVDMLQAYLCKRHGTAESRVAKFCETGGVALILEKRI